MQPVTRNQFLVLVVLLRHPMHPYAMRQEIIELTSHRTWLSHSSVHQAVGSLLKLGYIEEGVTNPDYWLKARRGAPHQITDKGYWFIRRELSMYHEVFVKARSWLDKFQ